MSRQWLLALLVAGIALGVGYTLLQSRLPTLPAATRVVSSALQASHFNLPILVLGGRGAVYGARGGKLYRLGGHGREAALMFTFPDHVTAIHERKDGLLIVITDNDQWDPQKPCRVYRSSDAGKTFEQVKQIDGGSALWWSITSDRDGRLYLAEYGPQKKGMSKNLWRSDDDGGTWRVIFQAPDRDKVHLHRIAVDPFSDELWLTVGDGRNRMMLTSRDHGEHWQEIERLQATAVAFDQDAIYWGMDRKGEPGVLRYDRDSGQFSTLFDPSSRGNYGGSVYDMVGLPDGGLVVPFMKYPDQDHVASVWQRQPDGEWRPLLELASERGKGSGFNTVAGPDNDGWVYMPGYQFKVTSDRGD